jgi:cytochrome c oxidase assembly protein subunit 11
MNNDTKQKNTRLIRILVFVAVGMFGFGYALVPLYDVMCEVVFKK